MSMGRRALLTGSVAAAVGCGHRREISEHGLPEVPRDWASRGPAGPDFSALRRSLKGELVLRSDAPYDAVRVSQNARYDSVAYPAAIVQCGNESDVQEAIRFARRSSLRLVARGGGHSYAGYSNCQNGIVLDLSLMSDVKGESEIAHIGAGALLVDVYSNLAKDCLSIAGGTCPSVGVAGLTLGGGMGVVARKFGLTCDRLVEARVVTPEGELITCDANREADLFWALRGAGGGNFCVVTQFGFRPYRLDVLTTFRVTFAFRDAAAAFAAWQGWGPLAVDEVWSAFHLSANGKVGELPEVALVGACIGRVSDVELLLRPVLNRLKGNPTSVTHQVYEGGNIVNGLADCEGKSLSECHKPGRTSDAKLKRNVFVATSDVFSNPLTEDGIALLMSQVLLRQKSGRQGMVLCDALGGTINRTAPHETAFVHRRDQFTAQYLVELEAGVEQVTIADAEQWADALRKSMSKWSSGRAYQNYIDPRLANWKAAYYGENYARLVAVQKRWDPGRFFSSPQGV